MSASVTSGLYDLAVDDEEAAESAGDVGEDEVLGVGRDWEYSTAFERISLAISLSSDLTPDYEMISINLIPHSIIPAHILTSRV